MPQSNSSLDEETQLQGKWTSSISEVMPEEIDGWANKLSLHMESHFPSKDGPAIKQHLKNLIRELPKNWESLRDSPLYLLAKPKSCGGILPMNPPLEKRNESKCSYRPPSPTPTFIPEDPWWRNC